MFLLFYGSVVLASCVSMFLWFSDDDVYLLPPQTDAWLLAPCDERLPALCRREGRAPGAEEDKGCPEVRSQVQTRETQMLKGL